MLASRCFFSGVRHVRRRWCDHHRRLAVRCGSWGLARCVAARSEALPAMPETGQPIPDNRNCHRTCNPAGHTALVVARPNAAGCRNGPNQHLRLHRRLDYRLAGSFAAAHRMLRTGLARQTASTRKHQTPEPPLLSLPMRFRNYPQPTAPQPAAGQTTSAESIPR